MIKFSSWQIWWILFAFCTLNVIVTLAKPNVREYLNKDKTNVTKSEYINKSNDRKQDPAPAEQKGTTNSPADSEDYDQYQGGDFFWPNGHYYIYDDEIEDNSTNKMNHEGHNMNMNPTATTAGGQMNHVTDGGNAGHSLHGSALDHVMQMYFHTGYDEYILFKEWRVQSALGMFGSCVVVFILAFLYEGLKVLREYLLRRFSVRTRSTNYAMPNSISNDSNQSMVVSGSGYIHQKLCSYGHFLQTFLHIVQIVVSYFLMLIFMTYNVWLALAIALGAGFGYFIFGWRKAVVIDINEHCH